jgi:hypothetical protein
MYTSVFKANRFNAVMSIYPEHFNEWDFIASWSKKPELRISYIKWFFLEHLGRHTFKEFSRILVKEFEHTKLYNIYAIFYKFDLVRMINDTFPGYAKYMNAYSYCEAQRTSQKLGIKTAKAYRELHKNDPKLPSRPYYTYKDCGWINWYDFLSKEKNDFYDFDTAKTTVQKFGVLSQSQYLKIREMNKQLPYEPHVHYKEKGWVDWYHFLGKNRIR